MAAGRYLRRLSILPNSSFSYYAKSSNTVLNKRLIQIWAPLCGSPIRVVMPSLSPTMAEGTIVKWYKKEALRYDVSDFKHECRNALLKQMFKLSSTRVVILAGDAVKPGDVLCDIQTDKAVMALETEEEGTLAKILKPENSQAVKIGTLIALMAEQNDDWRKVEVPSDAAAGSETKATAKGTTVAAVSEKDVTGHNLAQLHGVGPAVRALLDVYGLKVSDVQSTGPHGTLLKGDILHHVSQKNLRPVAVPVPVEAAPIASAPQGASASKSVKKSSGSSPSVTVRSPAGASYTDIPLTNIRSIIARRLLESKVTIPHSYSSIDCHMDNLLKMRNTMTGQGQKVSVNDFIVKSVAVALQRVPEVNAFWGKDEQIHLLSNIDISVAVATSNGLITPIVKNADQLSLVDVSTTTKNLSAKARENKLKPEEFQGGTFTISNLGMYGITEFTAIINPPQSCILAVGASRLEVSDGGAPYTVMTVTMSSDSRVVDDFSAAKFLQVLKQVVESPSLSLSVVSNASSILQQNAFQ